MWMMIAYLSTNAIISLDAFDRLRQQYGSDGADGVEIDPPAHIDVWVYDGDLPMGCSSQMAHSHLLPTARSTGCRR